MRISPILRGAAGARAAMARTHSISLHKRNIHGRHLLSLAYAESAAAPRVVERGNHWTSRFKAVPGQIGRLAAGAHFFSASPSAHLVGVEEIK